MDFDGIWKMVLSFVSDSGIWAMLFVVLLIILITSNNHREEKYQEIIRALSNALKKVEEVKEDVEDIKFTIGIGGNSKLQKVQNQDKEVEKQNKTGQLNQESANKEEENDS